MSSKQHLSSPPGLPVSLQPCGAMAASPALGADDGSATASPNSSAPAWMSFDGQPSGAWQSGKFYGQDGFPLPNASVMLVSGDACRSPAPGCSATSRSR